jgi:hypothetical protein
VKTTAENVLAAPCGLLCGICSVYKEGNCPGCREIEGKCPLLHQACDTYACVKSRDIDFCYECSDFPCVKIQPALDKADALPHNIKVFNLCYMKQHGLAKWKEVAPEIRERYFTGKMKIGRGPKMENE